MSPLPKLHPSVDQFDTPCLTVPQAKEIIKAAKRIIDHNTKLEDIDELDRMGMPGYFKWKPSTDKRHTCDMEVRMVFRFVGDTIEIIAASERDDVYSKARSRIRQLAGV